MWQPWQRERRRRREKHYKERLLCGGAARKNRDDGGGGGGKEKSSGSLDAGATGAIDHPSNARLTRDHGYVIFFFLFFWHGQSTSSWSSTMHRLTAYEGRGRERGLRKGENLGQGSTRGTYPQRQGKKRRGSGVCGTSFRSSHPASTTQGFVCSSWEQRQRQTPERDIPIFLPLWRHFTSKTF